MVSCQVAEIIRASEEEDLDTMSQLNPNAAEFVPISSPTKTSISPAALANFANEIVLAQSPAKSNPATDVELEIDVPNEQDFEKEAKSRPSDLFSNGHENESVCTQ